MKKKEDLKTIIVTGCNKGIGYGIIENLYQKPYEIIMACRNLELAKEAKLKLENQFPAAKGKLHPYQLDITKQDSVDQFITQFTAQFKQVDILLNNAGVAVKGDDFNEKVAAFTLETNFFSTADFTLKMTPLIKQNGKIIIVASSAGKLTSITQNSLLNMLTSEDLTIEQMKQLGKEFIEEAKTQEYEKKGWPRSCYRFVRVYSQSKEIIEKGIQVYALCPGWVRTDMAGEKAPLTIQQGALTPVFLVELPFEINPKYQGKFFYLNAVTSLL